METQCQVRRVDRERAISTEQLGSKPKFWFRDDRRRLLFKGEERGTGEDWAEVVSAKLCELLGLPHVQYELAAEYRGGQFAYPGVVCENLIHRGEDLILGNVLLLIEDPNYPRHQRRKVRQHSRSAVTDAIWNCRPPTGSDQMPKVCQTAGGAFIGYLMLDAWIANTDRHHENWGVVWDGTTFRLAPTFDHGAALAHNLRDAEREERLSTRDRNRSVAAFAGKGESALFLSDDEKKPMKLLEAFHEFAKHTPEAGAAWIERLGQIDLAKVTQIVERVPQNRMSTVCRNFTLQLLEINHQRLLDLKL